MFLVTDEGVVAIDAPPSIGQNYLNAIAEVTDKPITHVIYSHAHLDHIGAAGIFPKNATYIAHQDTSAELKRAMSLTQNSSTIPPIPTISFPNNYMLQIGNQTLNLDYYGDNHMSGNLFIYAPNQKTLMLVDVVFPGWVPFVGGKPFEFFSPIFNIADASISVGVITLLVFQKKFFKRNENSDVHPTVQTNSEVSDQAHIM